jgi:hypothetical protein
MEASRNGQITAMQPVIVTLTEISYQPGKRREFFNDTIKVLDDLPNQAGLLGYSFRFQLIGRKAWTMKAWENEAARDYFALTPAHRAAMANSDKTAQSMKFKTVTVPFSTLPVSWSEAHRLLENASEY